MATPTIAFPATACSRPNLLRQSFVAENLIVLDCEVDAFDELLDELWRTLQPEGGIEVAAFNDLLRARWNMERIQRLEADLFDGQTGPLQNEANAAQAGRCLRYFASWERSYYRALSELRRLQTDATLRMKLDAEPEERLTPLASGSAILRSPELLRRDRAAVARTNRQLLDDYFDPEIPNRKQIEAKAYAQYLREKSAKGG